MMTETEGSSNLLLPEENQMICGMIRSVPKAFIPDIEANALKFYSFKTISPENINVKC